MENFTVSCLPISTNAEKRWPYYQYYLGEKDQEQRRSGDGQNHWSGAESLEWYTGKFVRDMMHGAGVYRWRYKGPEEVFISYEGQFYGNRMHGYGVMSYPDGRVFNGLFYGNLRWGPGVESNSRLQENVGLWRGNQLVRLTWRPQTPAVVPDLNSTPISKTAVETHRTLLTTRVYPIGEVNSAVDLLKQSGAEPLTASKKWTKLYPKHCTDLASQLCQVDVFDQEYYKNNIFYLEEVDTMPETTKEDTSHNSENDSVNTNETYFAWNNNEMIVDMMKHCFKHEYQRSRSGINLQTILTGIRCLYKPAAKHEIDCRTLIMASYLGHTINVARLVNEADVYPDVADILGNSALMYATCGDRADIMHFLVEAGANVNSFNDSCCTPLAVALLRFACESKDIAIGARIQALAPPTSATVSLPIVKSLEEKPSEWHITRDLLPISPNPLTRTPSKLKTNGQKKPRMSTADDTTYKKKTIVPTPPKKDKETDDDDTDDMFSDEKRNFHIINTEFMAKVADLFSIQSTVSPTPYLFEVKDMVEEVLVIEERHKKNLEKVPKKTNPSKMVKDKPSQEKMWQSSEKNVSLNSADQTKIETLSHIMSTILQLLSDGADPRLVRCPQPALWLAVASGCPDLVRHLVQYGADINEVNSNVKPILHLFASLLLHLSAFCCSQRNTLSLDSSISKSNLFRILNYTILDAAISQPLTHENLALTRAILECGAKADHRLKYEEAASTDHQVFQHLGPTLLHAVLAKNPGDDNEEEIRCQLLELLLEYNCDALSQFKGSSAIETAMIVKFDLVDIFVESSKVDLNAVINNSNQSVLVKLFSLEFCKTIPVAERLNILTKLLLYGADPLLECQDGHQKYVNIFAFAKHNLTELLPATTKTTGVSGVKNEVKSKKSIEKTKKEMNDNVSSKITSKLGSDELANYKQALDLMSSCARLLHGRWIQAKLLKELIHVVVKFEHRHWNLILPEHKNKKACGLWLTCPRSLEIWDILKTDKKKNINDRRLLRHVLCIVSFNSHRAKTSFKKPLTTEEKGMIESNVSSIIREHKVARANVVAAEQIHWARAYVTPELNAGAVAENKFQVCFECALPFQEKILCSFCKQVSFCSLKCMRINIDRVACHPCSENLMNKHFPNTLGTASRHSNSS